MEPNVNAPSTLTAVNGLLTSTWNRLSANGTPVELPAFVPATPWAVSETVPQDLKEPSREAFDARWAAFEAEALDLTALRTTVRSTDDVDTAPFEAFEEAAADYLDVPARNAVPRGAVDPAIGEEGQAWLAANATAHSVVEVPAYHTASAPVVVRVRAQHGAASVAALDLRVCEGAQVKLVVEADSPASGSGVVGVRLRIIAEAGARVEVQQLQTLDTNWLYLESFESKLANSARMDVHQTYLGGAFSAIALGSALQGAKSTINIDTSYLADGTSKLDFNYLIRQFGKQSHADLLANGVLTGEADKILRGTIDLIHGCKGAKGHELETVLLANGKVRNRTIPIILCDEDDVQGEHGATIGHLPASQRYYLASRGLDERQAEALLLRSLFEKALVNAYDGESERAIKRLAQTTLGFPLDEEDEPKDEAAVQAAIDAKLAAGLAAAAANRKGE